VYKFPARRHIRKFSLPQNPNIIVKFLNFNRGSQTIGSVIL
jgi:hypothetical protein